MILFDQQEKERTSMTRIKVVGVGGAGGNTINFMIKAGMKGVEFYAANTDAQALEHSLAKIKIQLGQKSTRGLGAGANPEVGKRAAEEDLDKIVDSLGDADIVFITGGLGKGTGSGAIPVIAQALKEKGVLTIVVVTKPFMHDGKRRTTIANQAIENIKVAADTLIVIPNERLLEVADDSISILDGFGMIYELINQSVRSVSDIITGAGYINVDFADVVGIMKDKGLAVMGTGRASGPGRAKKAALEAISSPLLENMSISGARAVLLNITGGLNLGLHEMSEAASVIYDLADEDANIILGSVIDPLLENEVSVTVIATEFPALQMDKQPLLKEAAFYTPVSRVPQQKQAASEIYALEIPKELMIEPIANPVDAQKQELEALKAAEEARVVLAQKQELEALKIAQQELVALAQKQELEAIKMAEEAIALVYKQELEAIKMVEEAAGQELELQAVKTAQEALRQELKASQQESVALAQKQELEALKIAEEVAGQELELQAAKTAQEVLRQELEALKIAQQESIALAQKQELEALEMAEESIAFAQKQELEAIKAAQEVVKQELELQAAKDAQEVLMQELKALQEELKSAREVIILPVAAAAVNEKVEDHHKDEISCPVGSLDEKSCVVRPLTEEEEFDLLLKEEEALLKERSLGAAGMIDINDLDVPAFMRRQVKEKQNRE